MATRLAVLALAVPAATLLPAPLSAAVAAEGPAPTVELSSVKINRDDASGEYGGTVELRMRVCASLGPRARMITLETRTVDRKVVAKRRSYEPMGVDLTQVYPYGCAPGFRAGWVVPARLMRQPGLYHATIWMVDGFGRRSAPVRVSG